MTGTMKQGRNGSDQTKGKGGMPPMAKDFSVPTFGGPAAKIVPSAEHEAFFEFAKGKPRLLALLRKSTLTQDEQTQVRAAYDAFSEGKKSTALVKSEAATLAPVLKMDVEEVAVILEDYTVEQVTALVRLAPTLDAESNAVLRIDHELMEDGSYATRAEETAAVSMAHGRLVKAIKGELDVVKNRKVARYDESLDQLERRLIQTHTARLVVEYLDQGMNEEQAEEKAKEDALMPATKEYARIARERIEGAKKAVIAPDAHELDISVVVEIFKLFNYNSGDLDAFVTYFEGDFGFEQGLKRVTRQDVLDAVESALVDFLKKRTMPIVLNERSTLYDMVITEVPDLKGPSQ